MLGFWRLLGLWAVLVASPVGLRCLVFGVFSGWWGAVRGQRPGSKILGFRCLPNVRGGAWGKALGSKILGLRCLPGVHAACVSNPCACSVWLLAFSRRARGACGQPLGLRCLFFVVFLACGAVFVAGPCASNG